MFFLKEPVKNNDPGSGEFPDGPSVARFMPYLDKDSNLYIIWLQDMTRESKMDDGTFEIVQTNELYASAKIGEAGSGGAVEDKNRWSVPVRLTDDDKYYDEAARVNLSGQDKLIVAANCYELALIPDGVPGGSATRTEAATMLMHFSTDVD